jgi:hypothetical protein
MQRRLRVPLARAKPGHETPRPRTTLLERFQGSPNGVFNDLLVRRE